MVEGAALEANTGGRATVIMETWGRGGRGAVGQHVTRLPAVEADQLLGPGQLLLRDAALAFHRAI